MVVTTSISYAQTTYPPGDPGPIYTTQVTTIENESDVAVKVRLKRINATNCSPSLFLLYPNVVPPNTSIDIELPELVYSNTAQVYITNTCNGTASVNVHNYCLSNCNNGVGASTAVLVYEPTCAEPAEFINVSWSNCNGGTILISN